MQPNVTILVLTAIVATIGVVNLALAHALQAGTWPKSWHLSRPCRLGIVATLGVVSAVCTGALNGVTTWSQFGLAVGLGLLSAVPGLVREWIQAFLAPVALLALLLAGQVLAGCAYTKPGCKIIHAMDALCVTIIAADGSQVSVSRDDMASADRLSVALARKGSVGCPK